METNSCYMIKKVCVFLTVAVISSLTLLSSAAIAQSQPDKKESITLSPSSDRFTIDAGSSRKGTMKVINSGDVAYDITLYARPYSVINENYDVNVNEPRPNADAFRWITFDKLSYFVAPGQTVNVSYTINVPSGASPGGHYGVLFAETKANEIGQTGVGRQKRVGKVLYITVNGQYRMGGAVKEFILPFWQKGPVVQSSARVENTGNADFVAQVRTEAKDLFGTTKFTYTGDPVVLPETTRRVDMKWEKAPSFGLFNVHQTVEFLGKKHENSSYVLVAPLWFPILILGLLLGGIAYGVWRLRKR